MSDLPIQPTQPPSRVVDMSMELTPPPLGAVISRTWGRQVCAWHILSSSERENPR